MERSDVIKRLVPLMEDVFDEDDIAYDDASTADDFAEWDSLSHIRFMVAVEKHFGIRFSTSEMESFKNLGELVAAIGAKAT